MKNLYEILEVEETADAKEIKKAYRAKALAYHPDVNPAADTEEKFLEVQEAYLVLSDPKKRATYDSGFELPEVESPQRQPYPPPHAFKERKSPFGMFEGTDVIMDYHRYMTTARIIGLVSFLFAFTFLIDYFFYSERTGLTVTQLKSKAMVTNRSEDVKMVIVTAGDIVFDKARNVNNEFKIGEIIDLRSSLIYGYVKYKRQTDDGFRTATMITNIVHSGALIIYIASLMAIFTKENPELKFNAALVAGFFSIAVLAFVWLT